MYVAKSVFCSHLIRIHGGTSYYSIAISISINLIVSSMFCSVYNFMYVIAY